MKVKKMIYYKPNKSGDIPCDIAKPGSAEYYKDVLSNIEAIGKDYDGFNPNSAKQMKHLVDDLVKLAANALAGKPQYISPKEKGGKNR